jgi:hypothetical protein
VAQAARRSRPGFEVTICDLKPKPRQVLAAYEFLLIIGTFGGLRPTTTAAAMEPTETNLRTTSLETRIHELRGHNVILDDDLAALYAVEVKVLNQAVARNGDRFPPDFMFQLTHEEAARVRPQTERSPGRGGRRYLPFAFTEEGVAMLSSVLRSDRAVRVNVEIMRAFVRMRRMVIDHKDLSRRLDDLEARYDDQFKVVFEAIRQLMEPPPEPAKVIGFRTDAED